MADIYLSDLPAEGTQAGRFLAVGEVWGVLAFWSENRYFYRKNVQLQEFHRCFFPADTVKRRVIETSQIFSRVYILCLIGMIGRRSLSDHKLASNKKELNE